MRPKAYIVRSHFLPCLLFLYRIPHFALLVFNFEKKKHLLTPVSPAYSFLDPTIQGPIVAAYIAGILVVYAILFSLVRMVIVLRERWAMKNGQVLRVSGSGVEARPNASIDDDWEEVESPVSVARAKGDV